MNAGFGPLAGEFSGCMGFDETDRLWKVAIKHNEGGRIFIGKGPTLNKAQQSVVSQIARVYECPVSIEDLFAPAKEAEQG